MCKYVILTIGYGNMGVQKFISELKRLSINCIVDVRSKPYSKYNVAFNKEEIKQRLNKEKINYCWLGTKLGGRYDKVSLCDNTGKVNYDKVAKSENFKEGIIELSSLAKEYNVCIMCSEKDPLRCHRFLLISRYLKQFDVYHIMSDGSLLLNSELEQKLFERSTNLRQISLFSEENDESFENKVYRVQSEKTAYVSQKVKAWFDNGTIEDLPQKIRVFTIGCQSKTAEQFFTLLKKNNVKRIIDVRQRNEDMHPGFAMYPDIRYYCSINGIEYRRDNRLIPDFGDVCLLADGKISNAEFSRRYIAKIENDNVVYDVVVNEFDGTCFLGVEEDYKKCHRSVITNVLRKAVENLYVRHLR